MATGFNPMHKKKDSEAFSDSRSSKRSDSGRDVLVAVQEYEEPTSIEIPNKRKSKVAHGEISSKLPTLK